MEARNRGQRGAGSDGAPGSALRARPGEAARVVLWALTFAATFWAGNSTIIGNSGFALFWPASAVAAVWFATSPFGRPRPAEIALLAAVAGGTAYALDLPGWQVLAAAAGAPVAATVFTLLARRWAPEMWTASGPREMRSLREYGALVGAAIAAGAAEACVALVTLLAEPGPRFEQAGEIAITHTIAMVTLGGAGITVAGWLAGTPAASGPAGRILAGIRRDTSRRDAVTAVGVVAVAVVVFLAGYVWFVEAPVSFVLVMVVVVVAIRFSPTTTALLCMAIAGAACWFTVDGHGPVAGLPDPHRRALAFGLFVTALTVTGLTIALSRRERDTTIVRLQESERAAELIADDLRLVLANLDEGVAVVEEGGRFIHANAAIGRLLEMPEFDDEQVQPVGVYGLVHHPDGRPLLESEVPHVRAFAGEEDAHDILRLDRPDVPGGRIFEVWSRLLPQIRSTDKPRAVTMIRDVTSDHEQRDALTAFAHVVAHDLRSPLTSVQLWARELLEGFEAGPVDHATGAMMLGHIDSAAGRMQNFISDLLSYALARDQTPSPVKLELTDVVEAVVETIAAVEGVEPQVQYADLPDVWCDPVLVPQLFDNLIGNARKYVADGVVPRVRIEATALGDDWTRVSVIDNGIGIDPEDRLRVFETFERAHGAAYDGTGLGLAICRHIVERHGGRIGVAAPPEGSGTCIELTLPMTDGAFDRATARPEH